MELVMLQAQGHFKSQLKETHAQDGEIIIADPYFENMKLCEAGGLDLLSGHKVQDIEHVGPSPFSKVFYDTIFTISIGSILIHHWIEYLT